MEWISVEERLPDSDSGRKGVLVIDYKGNYHIADFEIEEQSRLKDWRFWDNARQCWALPRFDITHWMSLPPPPKKKVRKEGWVDIEDIHVNPTKGWVAYSGYRGKPASVTQREAWVKVTYEVEE